ncbi:MAG: Nramp family divalent metal transporter [Pirellulaceae bacterium]|jgi:Mn2+/Fe2+ NRAMP family transporter|nr:Nramp family divalent metal transporter [Pirellulaceae bacterium]MDP7019495.1 Nramp family divalent metal transporter [Pirellulaceae bacterium]
MSDGSESTKTDVSTIEQPPREIAGILKRLGPGLIIAGSIVGSGELIATTETGAKAGFWLLWLILIGCVIKCFVQVELGRYTLISGKTSLDALAEVPGPRIKGHGNWLIWFWALVFLATIGQVGGIVGGVGQSLQISIPLTSAGREFNSQLDRETKYSVAIAQLALAEKRTVGDDPAMSVEEVQATVDRLGPQIVDERGEVAKAQIAAATGERATLLQQALAIHESRVAEFGDKPELVFNVDGGSESDELKAAVKSLGRRTANDDKIWACFIAFVTALVLVVGRYGFIQSFSTVMVASFTLITIVNLFMLQNNAYWAVGLSDIADGMKFRLPPAPAGETQLSVLAVALATFGIIGVGANELISYPYWCIEKGYARFTGKIDQSEEWGERARGWMRVMRWDAWCSMVVYTFATIAFYLLGAAILGRIGLHPKGTDMIRTLGVMYEPVFGSIARWIFLFGAIAVLYSTFFVATASLARVVTDGLRVLGVGPRTEAGYRRGIQVMSVLFPFMCVAAYTMWSQPVMLVLIGGVMQGVMLPMLAGAALYFRYKRADSRITPGMAWDAFLWLSAIGMLITGLWTVWAKLEPYLKSLLESGS